MSNKDKIKDYLLTINQRFLNTETEHYDAETKTFNIGVFYVHESLKTYELRQIIDDNGDYRVIGEGEVNEAELIQLLAGFYAGYLATLDLLDLEYEETEVTKDNIEEQDLNPEAKEALKKILEDAEREEAN